MPPNIDTLNVAVRMTLAQRKLAKDLVSQLTDRLLLDCQNQRTLTLSMSEAAQLRAQAALAIQHAETGTTRNSLRHIIEAVNRGLEQIATSSPSAAGIVFRFMITLCDSKPPIWRRIEVRDGSLDDLHEHIQTAMGWTNSHLHQFMIEEKYFGDPALLDDGWGIESSSTPPRRD